MALSFGEWVRQKRVAADLSQTELGKRVGLSRQQIGRIESGEQGDKNIPTAIKICEALGADPKEGVALLVATHSGDSEKGDMPVEVGPGTRIVYNAPGIGKRVITFDERMLRMLVVYDASAFEELVESGKE